MSNVVFIGGAADCTREEVDSPTLIEALKDSIKVTRIDFGRNAVSTYEFRYYCELHECFIFECIKESTNEGKPIKYIID